MNTYTNSYTAISNDDSPIYRISDVSSILNLKSHVIRNWESELCIETPRSESGHRFYTQEQLNTFISIKKLKDRGFSLKQIKLILSDINEIASADDETLATLKNRLDTSQIIAPKENFKLTNENFSYLIKEIITEAISENIDALSKEISSNITDTLSKELNYQLIQHENIINDRLKAFEGTLLADHNKSIFNHLPLCSKLAKRVNSGCHLS